MDHLIPTAVTTFVVLVSAAVTVRLVRWTLSGIRGTILIVRAIEILVEEGFRAWDDPDVLEENVTRVLRDMRKTL